MSAPHLVFLAIGFPPAAKSSAYRLRETANLFAARGWDVTVISLERAAWNLEYGLDLSLLDGIHDRVRVVEMPLRRLDLEPDLRQWSRYRARLPERWRKQQRAKDEKEFPEAVFGRWRPVIERTAMEVHEEHPADLCLVSPSPYTMIAAALRLHRDAGVPIAVDYRDGWSLNVLTGEAAFAPDSRAGRIESELMQASRAVWVVNDPIKDFYAGRYPFLGDRLRVVRNGFDPVAVPDHQHAPDPKRGLRIGYLGTVNFMPSLMKAILDGWTLAREHDAVLRRSTLTFRGHMGASASRGSSANAQLVAATEGASYAGPVIKGELAHVYGEWDGLLLALAGGRYVTSGKVYEYAATGLPVLSVHEAEHDAASVLSDYPLWERPKSLDPEDIAVGFERLAQVALSATAQERAAAKAHGMAFSRRSQLEPAVAALAAEIEASRLP